MGVEEKLLSNEIERCVNADSAIKPPLPISAIAWPLAWIVTCATAMAGWAYGLIWVGWKLLQWADVL